MSGNTRTALLAGLLTLAAVWLGFRLDLHQPLWTWAHRTATPSAPTVLVVVMDTVRADHLSACGYHRPTSPTLEHLVDQGATLVCDAVAPGAWTLPTHASYFTGLPVHEHGADHVPRSEGGVDVFGTRDLVRPLSEEPETLAEAFAARGYQTAAVSGNPVVNEELGLLRGFEQARIATTHQWRGEMLIDELRGTLRELRTDGTPLFLFVNLIEAHQPYAEVPDGVGWVPPRPQIGYFQGTEDPWVQVVGGSLQGDARDALLEHITDGYDWGVYQSDRTLARVLDEVAGHGWLDRYRLIVVSDHGEFLGEHGLLDHGMFLYEPLARVPLLVGGTEPVPDLPAGLSAIEVHDLVLDGRPSGAPVVGSAQPSAFWARRSGGKIPEVATAAVWRGSDKELWIEGQTRRFDLSADPDELDGEPALPSDELVEVIEAAARAASREVDVSGKTLEQLEALGYVGGGAVP